MPINSEIISKEEKMSRAKHTRFSFKHGSNEYFLTFISDNSLDFSSQVSFIFEQYFKKLEELGINLQSGIYVNIYLSDSGNQEEYVRGTVEFKKLLQNNISVTLIQMPPTSSKIAILAYHLIAKSELTKSEIKVTNVLELFTGVKVAHNGMEHYYLKNLISDERLNVFNQSYNLFETIEDFCGKNNIPLDNLIRTWIYVRDIDNNYKDMVEARNKIFKKWGFFDKNKFPASTGIGGGTFNSQHHVFVDAVLANGLLPGQITKLEVPSHMNPTVEYGVSFERAINVEYGDRKHIYISGTASINNKGEIIHLGDIIKQTERTLENIKALIAQASCRMDDIAYLIVYLRDFNDECRVRQYLKENIPPHIPHLILRAKVCRPGWLIEIDGLAVAANNNPAYKIY
ncbi:MAG: hypothetical protein HQL27_02680 [Candidatus Omnitrophica bacterium]|nr:hypothetical protein [Candidatus Omnitrophota bacterium]